ncbi:hypothetical protein [Sulfurisoma sediminicola]|uniref:Uncharacterized protein n=1 Tax=Sulfurisoma sediminicola TaxID=1381557 RepID=A0A497XDR6_9PROT|nr:hypothetical protein [Sulfurisoma sediminicola]RLJ65152.1 hypothetical protein DFR35_1808 [Sulfurisoma sediminicola]
MFKLFQSIFGTSAEAHGKYSEDLIERATERAVDATDARMRAVSGYRKSLRPAIIHALDHIVAIVDGLAPPLVLNRSAFGSNAEVSDFFASVEDMNHILARDAEMRQWQASSGAPLADRVVALLLMTLNERNVFGVALEGDQLRHDVAQVTVSFGKHRFADPTADEQETRRMLMRRAGDHLLSLALGRIAETHGERRELQRERDLLRLKVKALAGGHWGFDSGDDAGEATDPEAVQQRIAEIDGQLASLGSGQLQAHLDILVDTLTRAEEHFRSEKATLCIDRQGIKQAQPGPMAPEIGLSVLRNAVGQSLVVRLVSIERGDLPPPPDMLREAQRFL